MKSSLDPKDAIFANEVYNFCFPIKIKVILSWSYGWLNGKTTKTYALGSSTKKYLLLVFIK